MWRVRLLLALVLVPVILTQDPAAASPRHTLPPLPVVGRYALALEDEAPSPERDLRRHQLRSWAAMWDLVRQVPESRRPRSILYPASGIHLAPLVLCEALPPGTPCHLELTELDPEVGGAISDLLAAMARAGAITQLDEPEDAPRLWRFFLGSHPVELRLTVVPPGEHRLITPTLLGHHHMVISHDWAGDPVTNLGVIHQLLLASRTAGRAPLLMIEDLETHPYPVGLELFGILARTGLPYGHRVSSRPGILGHSSIELGAPLFGGAVVLSFRDPWWRRVSPEDLEGVLNLLIFNRFGWSRRNVLAPGPPPVVPPASLDWWTGFGARTVTGTLQPPEKAFLRAMIRAAVRASGVMEPPSRNALCRELGHLHSTLNILAAGKWPPAPREKLAVIPVSALRGSMRALYDEAKQHRDLIPKERETVTGVARGTLPLFRARDVTALLRRCRTAKPVAAPSAP